MNDVFGSIGVLSRVINDALMEIENEIYDNPGIDIEIEKARIRAEIVAKFESVLSEFGLK